MSRVDGRDLIKKVKKLRPNVRTILVSAYEVEYNAVIQRYMQEGIIDLFLDKPVTINRLCQKVSEII